MVVLWVLAWNFGYAQISKDLKKETITDIAKVLEERYVFPELAQLMNEAVRNNYEKGLYDTITDPHAFALQLTMDLRAVSKDLHLGIEYHDNELSLDSGPNEMEEAEIKQWLDKILTENGYGIKKASILPGNIGYLDIPLFGPLDQTADTLVAAMKIIENTDALIIDLRNCMGSLDENTIPFLSSYFFDEPVHLFDFYIRPTDETKQFWTYAWLPYKKYLDKPIYVLTSKNTFSGGEELAYDLQQQKRAYLIGEATKGGANPNDAVVANKHFRIAVPYMRSVNPITKTNWEGVGVVPDNVVSAEKALEVAHLTALNTILQSTTDAEQITLLREQLDKISSVYR